MKFTTATLLAAMVAFAAASPIGPNGRGLARRLQMQRRETDPFAGNVVQLGGNGQPGVPASRAKRSAEAWAEAIAEAEADARANAVADAEAEAGHGGPRGGFKDARMLNAHVNQEGKDLLANLGHS